MILAKDYGWDVGNLHVIDWHLHREALPKTAGFEVSYWFFSPADWSR